MNFLHDIDEQSIGLSEIDLSSVGTEPESLAPLDYDLDVMQNMIDQVNEYEEVFADLDNMIHREFMAEVFVELKHKVQNMRLTRFYSNLRNSCGFVSYRPQMSSKTPKIDPKDAEKFDRKLWGPDDFKYAEDIKTAFRQKFQAKDHHKRGKKRKNFTPHMGLAQLVAGNFDVPSFLLDEIEDIVALLVACKGCASLTQFLSIVFLYVKARTNFSVARSVYEYCSELFHDIDYDDRHKRAREYTSAFDAHSGTVGDKPAWLNLFSDLVQNWSLIIDNGLTAQIMKLMCMVVSLGLCSTTDLNFSVKGFKIFDADACVKTLDTKSLIDSILNFVLYFVEGAWMCFQKRSITPLIVGNADSSDMDAQYADICAMWDLVRNGNLKKMRNLEDHEFDMTLEKFTSRLKLYMNSAPAFERKIATDRYTKLLTMRNDYVSLKLAGSIREAPFAIELFGESSQGKTTLGELIENCLLQAAKLPMGKEYRTIINSSDKFDPTMKTNTIVVRADDFANDRSDTTNVNITRMILDYINNQIAYANKPEAQDKGKSFIEALLFMLSTNVKDLAAGAYSNCPYSIQRRMNYVITVEAKRTLQKISSSGKACGLDSSKVIASHTDADGVYRPPEIDDTWFLTVERAVQPEKLSDVATYEVVSDPSTGQRLQNVSAAVVISFLVDEFLKHRAEQKKLLERQAMQKKPLTPCCVEGCHSFASLCQKHKKENAAKKAEQEKLSKLTAGIACPDALVVPQKMKMEQQSGVSEMTQEYYDRIKLWYSRLNVFGHFRHSIVHSRYFNLFVCFAYRGEIIRALKQQTCANITLTILLMWFFPFFAWIFFPLFLFNQFALIQRVQTDIINRATEQCTWSVMNRNIRESNVVKFMALGVGATAIVTLVRTYRKMKPLLSQGSLMPKTMEDITNRDREVNVWNVTHGKNNAECTTDIARCTSPDQLQSKIDKNLLYGSFEHEGSVYCLNGLFISSNLVIVPYHYFAELHISEMEVTFTKDLPGKLGHSFTTRLSLKQGRYITGTDFCLCFSASGGSYFDIIKHFP
jgi:hypothetical protein